MVREGAGQDGDGAGKERRETGGRICVWKQKGRQGEDARERGEGHEV